MLIRLAHLILILSPLWMWDIHPAIQFQGALRATCFYINQIHRSATMQWNWMSCDLFSTFANLQMKSSSLLRFLHHLPVQNKRNPQMLLPTFLASPISLVLSISIKSSSLLWMSLFWSKVSMTLCRISDNHTSNTSKPCGGNWTWSRVYLKLSCNYHWPVLSNASSLG